jgi:hypothetical protein
LDSDDTPAKTLAYAHRALTANGQPAPAHGAFSLAANGVTVALFLIPSDVEAGDLEKLCLATLSGDRLLPIAREFLANVNRDFGPLPALHKSLAQIYLACRKEDTRGVGQAFRDGIFIQHHACLAPIKDFLRAFIR